MDGAVHPSPPARLWLAALTIASTCNVVMSARSSLTIAAGRRYSDGAAIARQALCPPKPNEVLITSFGDASRPVWGM
jgi:hypothetical protein